MVRSGPLRTEAQWKKIAPMLPKQSKQRKGGRPWIENRRVLEESLWILGSGARWQDMPEKYRHPSTCWRRLRDWDEQGVWLNIWRAFLSELNERRQLKWSESFLDGRALRRYRRRWIVERTNAWLGNFRLLAVRYDRSRSVARSFIRLLRDRLTEGCAIASSCGLRKFGRKALVFPTDGSEWARNMSEMVLFQGRIQQAGNLNRIRVLLADDHPVFPHLVESVLEPVFEIIGSVSDGQSLIDTAMKLQPDVIVTDVSMPILNGIEAAVQLQKWGCASKIVFLSIHSDRDFVRACLSAGALGYVIKPRIAGDLVHAIQEALAGRIFVSPGLSHRN